MVFDKCMSASALAISRGLAYHSFNYLQLPAAPRVLWTGPSHRGDGHPWCLWSWGNRTASIGRTAGTGCGRPRDQVLGAGQHNGRKGSREETATDSSAHATPTRSDITES